MLPLDAAGLAALVALPLAEGVAGLAEAPAPEPKSDEAALKGEPARPVKLLVEADGLKAMDGSLMTDRGRPNALVEAEGVDASVRPE